MNKIVDRLSLRNIIFLSIFVRSLWLLVVAWSGGNVVTSDGVQYLELGQNLYEKAAYLDQGQEHYFRAPGYPLLIALGGVFGDLVWCTLWMQVALSTLTVWGVYRLTHFHWGSVHRAKLAALIYGFEPLSIIFTGYLLSEVMFTCALVWSVERLYVFVKGKDTLPLVVGSLCLCVAIFVRPIVLYFPWVLALYFIWRWGKKHKPLMWYSVAVLLACSLIPVGFWVKRNHDLFGVYSFSRNNDVFMSFQSVAVLSEVNNTTMEQSWLDLKEAVKKDDNAVSQVLLDHPFVFSKMFIKGYARTLGDPGSLDASKQLDIYPMEGGMVAIFVEKGVWAAATHLTAKYPVVAILTLLLGCYLLFIYYYAFKGLKVGWRLFLPLIALTVYLLLLSGGSVALARFRFPMMPWFVIFATLGMTLNGKIESSNDSRTN